MSEPNPGKLKQHEPPVKTTLTLKPNRYFLRLFINRVGILDEYI